MPEDNPYLVRSKHWIGTRWSMTPAYPLVLIDVAVQYNPFTSEYYTIEYNLQYTVLSSLN
jgi:hypothetical protein